MRFAKSYKLVGVAVDQRCLWLFASGRRQYQYDGEKKLYTFECKNKRLLTEVEAGLLASVGLSKSLTIKCNHPGCKKNIDYKKPPEPVP